MSLWWALNAAYRIRPRQIGLLILGLDTVKGLYALYAGRIRMKKFELEL